MGEEYWFRYTCPKTDPNTGIAYYNDLATLYFAVPHEVIACFQKSLSFIFKILWYFLLLGLYCSTADWLPFLRTDDQAVVCSGKRTWHLFQYPESASALDFIFHSFQSCVRCCNSGRNFHALHHGMITFGIELCVSISNRAWYCDIILTLKQPFLVWTNSLDLPTFLSNYRMNSCSCSICRLGPRLVLFLEECFKRIFQSKDLPSCSHSYLICKILIS